MRVDCITGLNKFFCNDGCLNECWHYLAGLSRDVYTFPPQAPCWRDAWLRAPAWADSTRSSAERREPIAPMTSSGPLSSARASPQRRAQYPRCYATMLFNGTDRNHANNESRMRRPFREDEQMVQLWARRMLGLTRLPIFIMHTGNVDVDAILGTVDDGARRLRRPSGRRPRRSGPRIQSRVDLRRRASRRTR